jgi:transcriptional regulator with GAF, ATPase, and Fis domain
VVSDPTRPDDPTIARPKLARPARARRSAFALSVSEGPDRGLSFVVDESRPGRVLIGTGPACELRLADRQVSRRHLAVAIEEVRGHAQLRVADLGSTNGTTVNGVAIVEVLLVGGEQLRIGETSILVERTEADAPPESRATGFGRVVGSSPEMRRLYPLLERLARSTVPVVIEGETGTGKELLAESIHEGGPRASGPFVVFDCTAVPPSLVESALFGHERGAFTGAIDTKKGVFEQAHGGTLLIDEIGDLALPLQAKLLRAIERSEVKRVGGDKWLKVDARILAATRRDLDKEVQAGRFRDDLFFRLAVGRIELPPLRARRGDVMTLARWFFRSLGGGDGALPADLVERLESYDWPGNVRELHNAVARRVALGDLPPLEDLSPRSERTRPTEPVGDPFEAWLELPFPQAKQGVQDAFERRYVENVLAKHGGNVARAAAASGIARRYFQIIKARQR